MKNLRQLQEAAYANACAKGWHERPLRTPVVVLGREVPGLTAGDVRVGPPQAVDHDRVLAKLALIHSELGEAWEAWTEYSVRMRHVDGKPEGFVVELADAAIRIFDLCSALDINVAAHTWPHWPAVSGHHNYLGIQEELLRVRFRVDQAIEAARVDDWAKFAEHLGGVLGKLAVICQVNKLDLYAAISAKMAYNETRPHRHGGKQA